MKLFISIPIVLILIFTGMSTWNPIFIVPLCLAILFMAFVIYCEININKTELDTKIRTIEISFTRNAEILEEELSKRIKEMENRLIVTNTAIANLKMQVVNPFAAKK